MTKRIGVVGVFALVACAFTETQANDKAIDLSGQWNVQGENLSGKVLLPGTLADAGLGVKQTSAHFSQYRERTSKTALARKYKYYGKAVYSRTVTLSKEDVEKPLELF